MLAPTELKMFFSLSGKMAITASLHLVWVFTSELFSTKHRVRIVGEASMVGRVGTIMVPYINDLLVGFLLGFMLCESHLCLI